MISRLREALDWRVQPIPKRTGTPKQTGISKRTGIPRQIVWGITSWLVVCFGASHVVACNIPVFRYALERWQPDDCEVVVLYDQDLTDAQQKKVDGINQRSLKQGGTANVSVVLARLGQSGPDSVERSSVTRSSDRGESFDARWEQIRRQDANARLPHVMIRTKLGKGRWVNHWHGSLDAGLPKGIWESPVRNELRKRLLDGHAIVWVMLAGKDSEQNKAVRERLARQFQPLAQRVELPEGIGLPGSELYAEVPLFLKFSLLEVDPNDEQEQFLIRLFSGLQPQAFERGEPLLIPVFGRGRALEVIPAADLSESLVENLTRFLSAACSCQVKEQNPGFDLMIPSDWEKALFGADGDRPPDRSALEGRNRPPIVLSVPPGRTRSTGSSSSSK